MEWKHIFLNDSWDDKLLLTWRAAPSRCPEERGPCTEPCQGFASCGGEVLLLLLRRLRGRLCWHVCRRSAFMLLILRSQPIRRLGARDNGVNLMPVRRNRWDALSVCHRSVRSVGKCFSWGGHGKIFPTVTHRAETLKLGGWHENKTFFSQLN